MVRRPEQHGLHPPEPRLPAEEHAQHAPLRAQPVGALDAHMGEREHRLLVAATKRCEPSDRLCQGERGRPGGERPFDGQVRLRRKCCRPGKPLLEKVVEPPDLPGRVAIAGRHRMSAAHREKPHLPRRDHRRPEIEPGHRPPGPLGQRRAARADAGRPVETLFDSRRHDADHARMPVLALEHHHAASRIELPRSGLHRARQDRRFHVLTLAVHPVEHPRDRERLRPVLGQQQPHAEPCIADPAARIDPRPERVAAGKGRRRLAAAGDLQ